MSGKQCSPMHILLIILFVDSSFDTVMMYMVAPAAICVFILTVIVILVLIAICFKVKKKTRSSNQMSVSYPRTNAASNSCTVQYMTNTDVVTFENEFIDNEIIYDFPETYHRSTDEMHISMQQKAVELKKSNPFVQPKM